MDFMEEMHDFMRGEPWRGKKGDPFYGSSLKIERADLHIRDLNARINTFLRNNPYVVVAEDEGQGDLRWVVRVRERVPETWGPIIGDAIHNLRDALDLAIYAFPPNGRKENWTYFPTADDETALKTKIDEGLNKWARPQVVTILKTVIEPYFGGAGWLLRALDRLSVIDKHRVLAPVLYAVEIHRIWAKGKFGRFGIPVLNPFVGPVEDGTILARSMPINGIEVGDYADSSLSISFDKSDARVDYLQVVPTLFKMRNEVESAHVSLRRYIDPPI